MKKEKVIKTREEKKKEEEEEEELENEINYVVRPSYKFLNLKRTGQEMTTVFIYLKINNQKQ